MKLELEHLGIGAIIVYVAFFTNPPPQIVSSLLSSPLGHVAVLGLILYVFMNKLELLALLLAIALIVSDSKRYEFLDEKEQKPKEKEQPKSGAPKPEIAGKLAGLLSGKNGILKQEAGKSVTKPPPQKAHPKPHADPKVTEKFSDF